MVAPRAPRGWRPLTLQVPVRVAAVASTPIVQRQEQEQVFMWRLGGRLPMAVLAIAPGGYTHLAVPGSVIYAPDGHATALRARYGPYGTALRGLHPILGQPTQPIAVVALPLRRRGGGGALAYAV